MNELILNALAVGPMTAESISQAIRQPRRTVCTYLHYLCSDGKVQRRQARGTNGLWAKYCYALPEPIIIPQITIQAADYMWWHPTGTVPETIRRLIK
jgi:predicted transcriptional regulator